MTQRIVFIILFFAGIWLLVDDMSGDGKHYIESLAKKTAGVD